MKKLLSIIIPTYNAEQFLDKGLTSFLLDQIETDSLEKKQKYSKQLDQLEVVIVNDGTKDNSVAKAQEYVDRYPDTFKIVNKENGGHGSAINAGVMAITGTYFQVVDADDWVDTEILSEIMDLLEDETNNANCQGNYAVASTSNATNNASRQGDYAVTSPCDVTIHAHTTHNVTTGEIEHKHAICPDESKYYTLADIMEFWDDIYWNMTFHGVLYNTHFYRMQNYELAEHVFYEDQEYATIPLCQAKKIRIIDKELYQYRIGDVNQSVNKENLIKRLPHLETVILKMAEYEKIANNQDDEMKPGSGGKAYWLKKITKCITDYYHVALIVNRDKKAGRARVAAFNQKLIATHPAIYAEVAKKYKVFKLINNLGLSEAGYNNTIGFATELRSKMRKHELNQ